MNGGVDLHLHSARSDGWHEPGEVLAACRGLELWSLTDHDTLDGCREILRGGAPRGFVPGIELSATWRDREVHIVGLGLDPGDAALTALCAGQRAVRVARLDAILARLPASVRRGLQAAEIARGSSSPGRLHLARCLVAKGGAHSVGMAFANWLGDEHHADQGLPAFPAPAALASAIREAGGLAILAHPSAYGLPDAMLAAAEACGSALEGIEVRYPSIGELSEAFLVKLAAERGWLPSGGSDLHRLGARRPGHIGPPPEARPRIAERLARCRMPPKR